MIFRCIFLALLHGSVDCRADSYEAESLTTPLLVYKEKAASGGKCVAIDVSPISGQFLNIELPDRLGPGLYRAGLKMRISSRSEPLTKGLDLQCRIEGGSRNLNYLNLDADRYQDFFIEFEVREAVRPELKISWEHDEEVHNEALGVTVAKQETTELVPTLLEPDIDEGEGEEELAFLQGGRDLSEAGRVYVALDSIRVTPVTQIAAVRKIFSEKIHYEPGEDTYADVTVVNYQDDVLKGELTLHLNSMLDAGEEVGTQRIDVAAGESQVVRFKFSVGDSEFGREMSASLKHEGKVIHRHRDYFGVSRQIWKIGISGRGWPAGGSFGWAKRVDWLVEQNRSNYANYYEEFAWAPSDYDDMTPDTEEFWSGQTQYHGTVTDCRAVIDGLHKHGIKAITYGKSSGGALPGFETFRKHPDWYVRYDSGVLIEGGPEVDFLDRMRALDFSLGALDGWQSWQAQWVDSNVKEAVVFGAEEIVRSTEMFGWDGIRWDGQFVAWGENGYETSAANTKLVKEIVGKKFPKFVHGYNYLLAQYSDKRPEVNKVPMAPSGNLPDFEECARDGGLIMNESLRDFSNRNFSHRIMDVFLGATALEGDWVRSLGGYYLAIGFDRATLLDSLYNRIFFMASGARPYGQTGASSVGHFWKFATRYSCLVYDNTRRRVASPEQITEVDSKHPVWWKPFVYLHSWGGNRHQFVVHLIGKPESPKFNELRQPPPPLQTDVMVKLKLPKGWKPIKGWQVSMEIDGYQRALDLVTSDGSASLKLPNFRYWSMAIVELERLEDAEEFNFTDPVKAAREGYKIQQAEAVEASRKKAEQAGVAAKLEAEKKPTNDEDRLAASKLERVQNPVLMRNGVRDILSAKGVFHWMYSMDEAIGWAGGASIREAKMNKKGGWMQGLERSMPDMPGSFEQIADYDLLILNNVAANYMTLAQRYAIRLFVEAGGSLLVIGGEWSLDRGGFQNTFLEGLLPCTLPKASPTSTMMYKAGLPIRATDALKSRDRVRWTPSPKIFCLHDLKPNAGTTVYLEAGDRPLLFSAPYKKGKVAVFAGSTMGIAPDDTLPFWHWDGLELVLSEVIEDLLKGSEKIQTVDAPEIDRDAVIEKLFSLADLEEEERARIVRDLCAICDKEVAQGLVSALSTEIQLPTELYELITKTVRPFADKSFASEVQDVAQAELREVRAVGIGLLGRAVGKGASSRLLEHLDDFDLLIQKAAARGLADVADNNNVEALTRKLDEVRGKLPDDDEGMNDLSELNHELVVALYRSGHKPALRLLIETSERAAAQIVRFERRREALLEQAGTAFKLTPRERRIWVGKITRSKMRKRWWAGESRRLSLELNDIREDWLGTVFSAAKTVDEPATVSLVCQVLGRITGKPELFVPLISAKNTVVRCLALRKTSVESRLPAQAKDALHGLAGQPHHFERLFALSHMRALPLEDQVRMIEAGLVDAQPEVRIKARALINVFETVETRERLSKIRSPFDKWMVTD